VAGVGMKENGNTYYYIMDCLGNVRYVLNESGAVVKSYLYLEKEEKIGSCIIGFFRSIIKAEGGNENK